MHNFVLYLINAFKTAPSVMHVSVDGTFLKINFLWRHIKQVISGPVEGANPISQAPSGMSLS